MKSLLLFIIGLQASASAYKIYNAQSLHCRSSANTSSSIVRTYSASDNISLTCQISGETINGNSLWDKTTHGCFVSDYYLKTGSDGYVVDKCSAGNDSNGATSSSVPGPVGDDYPYRGKCSGVDPWNYYKCQCTSFAAWRINSRLGIKFHNYYKGPNWGNANTWDDAARKTNVLINSNPVPGCIAQTNAGTYGHVAWVTKVSGGSVTIEEYNHQVREGYSTRTVPKSSFSYIHIKV